jgi:hypothetical protein
MQSFSDSQYLELLVYSYLPACSIFHKIAVLSKKHRDSLPKAALLDQDKVLTLIHNGNLLPHTDSFLYAIRVVDGIQLIIDDKGDAEVE